MLGFSIERVEQGEFLYVGEGQRHRRSIVVAKQNLLTGGIRGYSQSGRLCRYPRRRGKRGGVVFAFRRTTMQPPPPTRLLAPRPRRRASSAASASAVRSASVQRAALQESRRRPARARQAPARRPCCGANRACRSTREPSRSSDDARRSSARSADDQPVESERMSADRRKRAFFSGRLDRALPAYRSRSLPESPAAGAGPHVDERFRP